MKEVANKIALGIMMDIKSRSGLKDSFEAISPSVRIELMGTWTNKIEAILKQELKTLEKPVEPKKTGGDRK